MFNLILRVVIIYIIVIFLLRLMGKRQLGEMEPFEFVITLIIADLACIPMTQTSAPLWHGIAPLLLIVLIHHILTLITKYSTKARRILSGNPTVIISPQGIHLKALKKLNIDPEEVYNSLRNNGFYQITDVEYAIMETNGKLSIIPKKAAEPANRHDLNINTHGHNPLYYCLVENGKINKHHLNTLNKTEQWLTEQIKHHMLYTLSQIALLFSAENGDCYAQTTDNKVFTFNYLKEDS